MQIIQNIRDKGAAIVIGVIALSLIGFLLMDARGSGNRLFGGSPGTSIGKVNGEAIDGKEYNKKIKDVEDRQNQTPTAAQMNQLRDQVWDQMTTEKIVNAEVEKLGIVFTPAELTSVLLSDDAPQILKQNFTDPASGTYDIEKATEWWKNLKSKRQKNNEKDKKEIESDQTQVIDPVVFNGLATKYNALFAAAAYYPSWMKEKDSADAANFATISYTSIPYNVVNDSTIKVTDDDIEKYLDKHKTQYKQEAGRVVSYYAFSSAPSRADTNAATNTLIELKPKFAADTNEKVFLVKNATNEPLNEDFIYKSKLQGQYKDTLSKLSKGTVFGPYIEKNNLVLAKIVDIKQQPDSVFVRHILIKIADLKNGQLSGPQIRQDTVARKLIDSIATAVKNGADFADLVAKYSDDGGSKTSKGEYHFNKDMSLVDSFYRTAFYQPVGTKKVVLGYDPNSYVGFHYIEVLNQFNFEPSYKIAYISREITSSDETIIDAGQNATKLSGTYRDAKALDAYAAKNGLQKISNPPVKETDYRLGSLEDARKVIQWAYGAKVGDVSEPFAVDDLNIVAVLEKVIKDGVPDAATARPMVEAEIKKQKIAEQIIKKIGTPATLEAAAAAYPGVSVQVAGQDSTITFDGSRIINFLGNEPKVLGACFNKENLNKISKPITGNLGIYFLQVNAIAAKNLLSPEEAKQRSAGREQSMGQQFQGWFQSLKKLATIKDERYKTNN
ncbi:MAG: peptidylprolyl isomerase [Ferruginibacter sp.]